MSSRICFEGRVLDAGPQLPAFPGLALLGLHDTPRVSWDFFPVILNTCSQDEICDLYVLCYLTLTSHFAETKSVCEVSIPETVKTTLVVSVSGIHLCSFP